MQLTWIDSLKKLLPAHDYVLDESYRQATALQGEVFSLQLAYKNEYLLNPMEIKVVSPLAEFIQVRQVRCMPAISFGEKQDEYVIDNRPGLYPDLLTDPETYRSAAGVFHALWITIRIPRDLPAKEYPLQVILTHHNAYSQDRCFTEQSPVFNLTVLDAELPPSELKVTEWLHCDCLASYYKVAPWSEEFFRILKNYLQNMVSHGINMVYVPLFTPPLDTHIGMERPTMQSVEIHEDDTGCWTFGFANMERFIELALECGMQYLEFSHLFTQWGAEYTPKIMVKKSDGTQVRRFGWDVRSNSELYQAFLAAFLPELNKVLTLHGWNDRAYFHISDEPYEQNLEAYRQASELFHRNLQGCKFIDALSRPEFFTNGLVDIPVPPNNHIKAFQDLDLPERWTYYCVSQWNKVPNQFAHLPSARNRIMGLLSYIYDLDGFLHWGYNFWFGQLSMFEVNPYEDICSGNGFPPGDAFKVYPGEDGAPEDSIRHEVMFEALQDLSALRLLEKRHGRSWVLELIKKSWDGVLPDMENYPRNEQWLLDLRAQVNSMLAEK